MINIEKIYKIDNINNYINKYLFEKNIINICTPTLFYSFPEYGNDEMYVDYYDDRYFLPQSHEYFTSFMSLFFKKSMYSIEKCYRNDKKASEKKALEFRQICICLYNNKIQDGLNFLKLFLYNLIEKKLNKSIKFTTISFNYSLKRYCDDSPDLRYGEYYLRKEKLDNVYIYNMYIKKSNIKSIDILSKISKHSSIKVAYRDIDNITDIPKDFDLIISLYSESSNISYSIKSKFSKIRKALFDKKFDYEVVIINSIPIKSENTIEHNIFTKIVKKGNLYIPDNEFTKCDIVINGLEIVSMGEKNNRKELVKNTLEFFENNGKYSESLFKLIKKHSDLWDNEVYRTTMGIGYERLLQVLLEEDHIHSVSFNRNDLFKIQVMSK